jgi:uncharacterized protein (DUF2252 family)
MSPAKKRASTVFQEAIAPPEQRRAAGKALRTIAPRTANAQWDPGADRADPIEVLVESNRTRQQDLVPLRYARMAASPFAFLRGSALVMASDIAASPTAGPEVMLCGDAHISNFGLYASPERRLVFDLNDFDEACQGPFEMDIKRLAASIVVAGRERGLDATATTRLVVDALDHYRDRMDQYGDMTRLDVYYARIDADDVAGLGVDGAARQRTDDFMRKVMGKNHLKALDKLTVMRDGRREIVQDPPILIPAKGPRLEERLDSALIRYHASLARDRQVLFEQYRFVDFARKVVGVGSVGTRCWILLLQGPNGGPLFLQMKEARQAVPHIALGRPPVEHEGRRVVESQRSIQAVSDILLGWTHDEVDGVQYFVRQMWDAKGSFDIAHMRPSGFRTYVRTCAWALARAHARTGDPATIAGYLGTASTFSNSMAAFAEAYADQTERDHAALVTALADGRLPAWEGIVV